jgi:hypothetical protein
MLCGALRLTAVASRSTPGTGQHPLENRRTAATAPGKSMMEHEKPVATRFCNKGALQIAPATGCLQFCRCRKQVLMKCSLL